MAKKEEKTLLSIHFLKGVELAQTPFWKISTLFFSKASLQWIFTCGKILTHKLSLTLR